MFTTFTSDGKIFDQFELQCTIRDISLGALSFASLTTLEEELRMMLLKLFVSENYAADFPKDGNWAILFATNAIDSSGRLSFQVYHES